MGRVIFILISLAALCGFVPPLAASAQSDRQFVVYFRDGDAALTGDANALVDRVIAAVRAHRPVRIELIGVNDGLSKAREDVADKRADTIAQSLRKAGVDPAIITRAGIEKPAGSGVSAHEVVIRFEDRQADEEVGSNE
jgi:outer membrane protein OmpA-like peptidoglycan-associated protein